MNEKNNSSVHWSFWGISILTLAWNAMGGLNFFMQLSPEAVASFPETHRAIIEGRPAWATAGFAVAVFGGTLGCLLLLFRRSAAYYVFIASLLGVMVTMAHTMDVISSSIEMGPFEMLMMVMMPVVVAVFLVWYSKLSARKEWIS